MSVKIGNVTIDFVPFIVCVAIIIIVSLVFRLYLLFHMRKVRKSFEAGAYDKAITDGERFLKTYKNIDKSYKHKYKYMIDEIEYLDFALAVSNFALMNWDCFLSHINSMSQYSDIKNFWLSLYYICQDNLDEAQTYYDNIAQTEANATNLSYLDSMICYKHGDVDSAKAKMECIYSELKHPILRDLADKSFYKNQNFS